MKKFPEHAVGKAERRRLAEARLKVLGPQTGTHRTNADTQRLMHELQVHQIELEMQNQELQRARDEMEASLEKYSDLYDFAPVGYLTLDREGTIQEVNLAAASLFGIERSALIQRRFGLAVSADDLPVFTQFLTTVFESKDRQFCEVTLLKEGKPLVPVRIEASASATGRECRAAVTDITAHKRAEEDRLILSKLESTGILAGGIAHDFNNLLTVILMNLDLAQAVIPPGGELARRLGQARDAALASRDLTQQLITFARGGGPIRKPICLSGVIRESTRAALSGSRVRCEFFLAENLWLAEVDAGQIRQVIHNIVLNAREAMPEGGTMLVRTENATLASREHPSLPPGEYVRLSIADRGYGIHKEELPKIFDPYYSTKQRGHLKGMGLGLTICHSVISKHGGAIAVESEAGLGTTFHVYLPAAPSLLGETRAPASTPRPLQLNRRMLVMDDEEGVRRVVGVSLQGMGHEVELVEDGQKAVEAWGRAKSQGAPFDAVILDLTVRAGMGGEEAVRALLALDPTVNAIVMSGYANDPVVLDPKRHGFKGVLVKPFGAQRLREILDRVMENGLDNIAAP